MLQEFYNLVLRKKYSFFAKHVLTADPDRLQRHGETQTIKTFQNAALRVPAYAALLRNMGIDPKTVHDIKTFHETVPIINKEILFTGHQLSALCLDGNLHNLRSIYSSSGHSGVFSFGIETTVTQRHSAFGVDFLLELAFKALTRKTLLINALPMGVKIHTSSIPLAETSVRADVIHALLKKLQNEFDQFILVGESPFLKFVIEEGIDAGVPWNNMVIHIVTGGEFIAENWRSYIGSLLGINYNQPENGMILVNMGLSEISNTIFFENPECVRLRREAHNNDALRETLYGPNTRVCPLIMQYFPQRFHLETIYHDDTKSSLVVTVADIQRKLPIIRYDTGDSARLIDFAKMEQLLTTCGMNKSLSSFRLPYALVVGKSQGMTCEEHFISPNAIKEAIYMHPTHASLLTGNFRIMAENGKPNVRIQLRMNTKISSSIHDDITSALHNYCGSSIHPIFDDYINFKYGIEHNFERKNKYV